MLIVKEKRSGDYLVVLSSRRPGTGDKADNLKLGRWRYELFSYE